MTYKLIPVALILTASGSLTSCATSPTPYQPYVAESGPGIHGGFSEQRLSADKFLVRFHGNEFTSRDRVEGYLLYRAAELTLQNGFAAFRVVNRNVEHDVETVIEPDPSYRPWYGRGYGGWRPDWRYYSPAAGWQSWSGWSGDPFWTDRVNVRRIEAFEASAEIEMKAGSGATDDPQNIDARRVVAELGATIQRPAATGAVPLRK